MTNTTTQSNMAADGFDGHNVIAVSFEDDRSAYKALSSLKELEAQQRLHVQEAVVVARGKDGQVVAKDRVESSDLSATAAAGLLGLLIGVIGGPLGVLVGGTYGLLVGSVFDLYDAGEADTALGAISGTVKVGQTALLAIVDEPSTDVVAAAMTDLGGTVARRSVADVEAEIAAGDDAERKAKQEARKELHRQRLAHDKETVNAKVAELKAKLHHRHQSESADADAAVAGATRSSIGR